MYTTFDFQGFEMPTGTVSLLNQIAGPSLVSGNHLAVTGPRFQAAPTSVSVDVGGRQATIIQGTRLNAAPAQGVKVKGTSVPAFQQLNDIGADLCAALTAAGTKKIIELGEVLYFLDISGTALVISKILAIPPGGGPPFDLVGLTRLKTSGDGWPIASWPAGKWTFIGLADCSALALKLVAIQFDEF